MLTEARNKRLVAFIARYPATGVQKLHLRILWDHRNDETFQLAVIRKQKKPMLEGTPRWKQTLTGVTFTLNDLSLFLENDLGDLLVNTFLDESLKQDMKNYVEIITKKQPGFVAPLFEEYKKESSNKEICQTLKELIKEFYGSGYDIDFTKLSKEFEVLFSLLLLNNCSEKLLQINLKKEKKKFKRIISFKSDQMVKKQKTSQF